MRFVFLKAFVQPNNMMNLIKGSLEASVALAQRCQRTEQTAFMEVTCLNSRDVTASSVLQYIMMTRVSRCHCEHVMVSNNRSSGQNV